MILNIRPISLLLISILFSFSFAVPAVAQLNIDSKRFAPSLDPDGFLGVQGTRTPSSWTLNLGVFFSYAYDPLEVPRESEESLSLVKHRLATDLTAETGLFGRLALALRIPFVPLQGGDFETEMSNSSQPGESFLDAGEYEIPAFAVSDPSIIARFRFIGDNSDDEKEHRDGPGMALQIGTLLPVGSKDAYLGEGATRTDLSLLADFQLLGAGIGVSIGWLHRFIPHWFWIDTSTLDRIRYRDEISFGIGLKMPIPWFEQVAGILELRGSTDGGKPFSRWETTPLESELGIRIGVSDFTLVGAVGTSLGSGLGAPDFRGILGLWWTPRSSDTDGDGIDDDDDECPPLAEDKDGYMDHDGCPDPDNDGDWIPDLDDLCPNEAADEDKDLNEDGCTDK